MKKTDLEDISKDIAEIKSHISGKKPPEHFSLNHAATAFLGSLLVGLPFVFRSMLFDVSLALTKTHLILIVVFTVFLLTAEIYFIGYSKVKDKKNRSFGQFWFKRIVTYYCIAIFVSVLLIYIYGINYFLVYPENIFKVAIVLSLPCGLGAALADLVGKY